MQCVHCCYGGAVLELVGICLRFRAWIPMHLGAEALHFGGPINLPLLDSHLAKNTNNSSLSFKEKSIDTFTLTDLVQP